MTGAPISPQGYLDLGAAQWAGLARGTDLGLPHAELATLLAGTLPGTAPEVAAGHLPFATLLSPRPPADPEAARVRDAFLGAAAARTGESGGPLVLAVGGSVAVGKSSSAHLIAELLRRLPAAPRVELISTDGFLFPMHELKARGLTGRKGYPESYDRDALARFIADLKAGRADARVPRYSHVDYDIVPGEFQIVGDPQIAIIEGLNTLQLDDAGERRPIVADLADTSIYVDAAEPDIERWFVARFLGLRETVFGDPRSFFHRFATLTDDEARRVAHQVWRKINLPNLRNHVLPARRRARLIIEKGPAHEVVRVRVRAR